MAEESTFRGVIEFLGRLGVYDVILPFLLVFSIVFAILEKTKVLGTEEIDGKVWSKKNLDAIVAFVVAFFVIASTELVKAINTALSQIVLLLLLIVFFLVLVGAFFKEGDGVFLESGGWKTTFMIISFAGIVLIFMNAIGWLMPFWEYLKDHWETQWVGSLILLVMVIAFIIFITKSPGDKPKKTEAAK